MTLEALNVSVLPQRVYCAVTGRTLCSRMSGGEGSKTTPPEKKGNETMAAEKKATKPLKKARNLEVVTPEELEQMVPARLRVEEEGETVQRARSMVTVFSDGTIISLEGLKPCPGPKCKGAIRPMADFGYRRMGTGIIRPQAYCKRCR